MDKKEALGKAHGGLKRHRSKTNRSTWGLVKDSKINLKISTKTISKLITTMSDLDQLQPIETLRSTKGKLV